MKKAILFTVLHQFSTDNLAKQSWPHRHQNHKSIGSGKHGRRLKQTSTLSNSAMSMKLIN